MTWKEAAAELGTSTFVSGLKALEGSMKKRDYKRLVSTTVAQLLELHPDIGAKKARRWARKATGTRPAKQRARKLTDLGPGEAATAAGMAALSATAAKVVGHLAGRIKDRVEHRADEVQHRTDEVEHRADEVEPRSAEADAPDTGSAEDNPPSHTG